MSSENSVKTPYFKALTHRMAIIMIVVSLAPMILVSGIILDQFNTYSRAMVHAHLGELVLKHKHNIDFFLREKMSDIRYFSRAFDTAKFQNEEFLQQKLQILQEEYSGVFVDLGLIAANGQQVAYAGPFKLAHAYYGDADWFNEALNTPYYISDVFLGLRAQPHFIVAVQTEAENTRWILRATIDFLAFNMLVENLRIGETGSAFIMNRSGDFQTRPPSDAKLSKQQYVNLFNKGKQTETYEFHGVEVLFPDQRTWKFQDGDDRDWIISVEKMSASGKKVVIVAAYLKNDEWMLVFQQDADEVFSKLNRTQTMAALIFGIGAIGIIAVAFFISNRMVKRIARADAEKNMMNQQIIETGKLASIGELAAGIAHEINNPVAIMVEEAGWIQDLLEEGIDQGDNLEEFTRALKQIGTQGRRCKEITHNLLSFARKTDSRVQTVQMNELIEEVIGLSSQRSRFANVEIHSQLEDSLPEIQASVTEMQQVLMNVINNALDAMEKQGGQLDIGSAHDSEHVIISIKDTGPGIPTANLGRLFDPFFTTKPVGKGTGLGLSICYGIIKKMGGDIQVESQVGIGATFRIVLPLEKDGELEPNRTV